MSRSKAGKISHEQVKQAVRDFEGKGGVICTLPDQRVVETREARKNYIYGRFDIELSPELDLYAGMDT